MTDEVKARLESALVGTEVFWCAKNDRERGLMLVQWMGIDGALMSTTPSEALRKRFDFCANAVTWDRIVLVRMRVTGVTTDGVVRNEVLLEVEMVEEVHRFVYDDERNRSLKWHLDALPESLR